ncbi:hypothetical protein B0H14DRAFT_3603295 [Mycena olivaceomarginata]|nr:hypothetical protein B0H14DRAFT_3603295 [Mycena olivaceomarginata]
MHAALLISLLPTPNHPPLPIDFTPLNRYLQAMAIDMCHYDTAAQGLDLAYEDVGIGRSYEIPFQVVHATPLRTTLAQVGCRRDGADAWRRILDGVFGGAGVTGRRHPARGNEEVSEEMVPVQKNAPRHPKAHGPLHSSNGVGSSEIGPEAPIRDARYEAAIVGVWSNEVPVAATRAEGGGGRLWG